MAAIPIGCCKLTYFFFLLLFFLFFLLSLFAG